MPIFLLHLKKTKKPRSEYVKQLTACQDKVALVFVQRELTELHCLAHHSDVTSNNKVYYK